MTDVPRNTNSDPKASDGKPGDSKSAERLLSRLQDGKEQITRQLRRRIVGQDAVIEQVLISLFAGGHCLMLLIQVRVYPSRLHSVINDISDQTSPNAHDPSNHHIHQLIGRHRPPG